MVVAEEYTPTDSDRARFWSKVDASGECWTWQASKTWAGYGRFRLPHKTLSAHRFSYLMEYGAIPDDLIIDHSCRNRDCVRPEHLRLVTWKQNSENKSESGQGCKSGVRGVHWLKDIGQWQARVGHAGRIHYAGTFKTVEEARSAVVTLRRNLHTHNTVDRV